LRGAVELAVATLLKTQLKTQWAYLNEPFDANNRVGANNHKQKQIQFQTFDIGLIMTETNPFPLYL
jgi:hypothetical protein